MSNTVSAMLIAEANHHTREESSKTAMLTDNWQGGGKNKRGRGRSKVNDECRYCHEKVHWVSKCPKHEEDEKKNNTGTANFVTSKLH